jgi:hypothetical protein
MRHESLKVLQESCVRRAELFQQINQPRKNKPQRLADTFERASKQISVNRLHFSNIDTMHDHH